MANPKNGNNIVLGYGGCLNYNILDINGNPTYVTNRKVATLEGCTSISDFNGNMLFYSDGIQLFDANDKLIAGTLLGTPLGGDSSSTQSGLAIKKPGTLNDWILFSISLKKDASAGAGSLGTGNLVYCIIKNPLVSGISPLLTVIGRNTILAGPGAPIHVTQVSEKICARKNSDGTYWVITKEVIGSNANYLAFKVNLDGSITNAPVLSPSGATAFAGNTGQIKLSVDGKYFISCRYNGTVELWDFNEATGIISNIRILPLAGFFSYGAEFSATSNRLYVTSDQAGIGSANAITQFKLDVVPNNQATIAATRTQIGISTRLRTGQLQLGPNNKILVAVCDSPSIGSNYVGVLNDPDELLGPVSYTENIPLNATGVGTGSVPSLYPIGTPITPGINRSLVGIGAYSLDVIQPSPAPIDPCDGFTAPAIALVNGKLTVPNTFSSYQWQLAGVDIVGAIGYVYSPTVSGSYTITVTSSTPCIATSAAFIVTVGCTSPIANNYNASANIEDGTCTYTPLFPPVDAPICGKDRTKFIGDKMQIARCKLGDMSSAYVDNQRIGVECEKDLRKIKHLSMLTNRIAAHIPVGDTEVDARGARVKFKLTSFASGQSLILTIKNGVNNVAVYYILTNSAMATDIQHQMLLEVNKHADIYKFIATPLLDGSAIIDAPAEYGINANGLTATFTTLGVTPIVVTFDPDNVFGGGRNEICAVSSCLTEPDIDIMLETTQELIDNCGCCGPELTKDDASYNTVTGDPTPAEPVTGDNGVDNGTLLIVSNFLELPNGDKIKVE